jgi:hypothetical protein
MEVALHFLLVLGVWLYWTVSSRILELVYDNHDERKIPIAFHGHRSKVKVIVSLNRKRACCQTITIQTVKLGILTSHAKCAC